MNRDREASEFLGLYRQLNPKGKRMIENLLNILSELSDDRRADLFELLEATRQEGLTA